MTPERRSEVVVRLVKKLVSLWVNLITEWYKNVTAEIDRGLKNRTKNKNIIITCRVSRVTRVLVAVI